MFNRRNFLAVCSTIPFVGNLGITQVKNDLSKEQAAGKKLAGDLYNFVCSERHAPDIVACMHGFEFSIADEYIEVGAKFKGEPFGMYVVEYKYGSSCKLDRQAIVQWARLEFHDLVDQFKKQILASKDMLLGSFLAASLIDYLENLPQDYAYPLVNSEFRLYPTFCRIFGILDVTSDKSIAHWITGTRVELPCNYDCKEHTLKYANIFFDLHLENKWLSKHGEAAEYVTRIAKVVS